MAQLEAEAMLLDFGFDLEHDEIELRRLTNLGGGEPRAAQLTGTKALMLAVLEDAIRCYLSSKKVIAAEADCWIQSGQRRSPFSFLIVCETLGLDPHAVRGAVKRLRDAKVSARQVMRRVRNNVRVPGRVCLRRSSASRGRRQAKRSPQLTKGPSPR
jgi:hypothetical protein